MTEPHDTLRAAAAKLRERATAASTDGRGTPTARWHFKKHDVLDSGYLYAENPDGPGVRLVRDSSGARTGHPGMRIRHGEYAATMHPGVGLALADWLDSAAEDAVEIGPDHHALAVARQILGDRRQQAP